jgi:RNA polymerase sigma-70 factor (sigma-E family)
MSRDDDFTAFVVARGPALRRTAFLMTSDWHEAEDLTQTALAKLYLAWPRVRSDGAEAYARRIVARTFIDARRRFWRREQPTERVPDSAGPLDRVDERLDLAQALAQLSASHRAVLVLRFWEDMSLEQVADALSLSTGTVKSQTSRALERVRTLMGADAVLVGTEPR